MVHQIDSRKNTWILTNPIVSSIKIFYPVGASIHLLEKAFSVLNNLMPLIGQAAIGRLLLPYLNDYNTPDGTCIRDFIHVVDLAKDILRLYRNVMKNRV